jgi:hypothetical protein
MDRGGPTTNPLFIDAEVKMAIRTGYYSNVIASPGSFLSSYPALFKLAVMLVDECQNGYSLIYGQT